MIYCAVVANPRGGEGRSLLRSALPDQCDQQRASNLLVSRIAPSSGGPHVIQAFFPASLPDSAGEAQSLALGAELELLAIGRGG